MLKYANYDIVFQEFPDEVTLAVNLSGCPNACPGCHSAYLQGDVGEPLTLAVLREFVEKYPGLTCIGLMGGDNSPSDVELLAWEISHEWGGEIKTGWYSGRQQLPEGFNVKPFSYIKLGPYVEALGPLKNKTTNQRLYRVSEESKLNDITERFWTR